MTAGVRLNAFQNYYGRIDFSNLINGNNDDNFEYLKDAFVTDRLWCVKTNKKGVYITNKVEYINPKDCAGFFIADKPYRSEDAGLTLYLTKQ